MPQVKKVGLYSASRPLFIFPFPVNHSSYSENDDGLSRTCLNNTYDCTEYSILLLGLDNAGKTTLLNQVKALYKVAPGASTNASGIVGEAPADPKAGNTVPTVGQNVATIDLPDMYLKIWDVGGQMSLRRLWTSYYKSCHGVVFVVDSSDLGALEDDDEDGGDGDIGMIGGGGGGAGSLGTGGGGLKTPVDETGKKWHGRRKSSYNIYSSPTSPTDDAGPMSPITEKSPTTPRMSRIHPSHLSGRHTGRLDECRAVLESVLSHSDMSGIPILVLANKQDREDCLEVVRIKEGFVRKVFEGEKGDMVRDSRVLPVSALNGTGVKEAVEWVRKRVVWNKIHREPVMR